MTDSLLVTDHIMKFEDKVLAAQKASKKRMADELLKSRIQEAEKVFNQYRWIPVTMSEWQIDGNVAKRTINFDSDDNVLLVVKFRSNSYEVFRHGTFDNYELFLDRVKVANKVYANYDFDWTIEHVSDWQESRNALTRFLWHPLEDSISFVVRFRENSAEL